MRLLLTLILIFADGSQKTPTGLRRTPSFQRALGRPGSSNTLPRKGSTTPTESGVRKRNPSGSSISGMSPSVSAGFNGSGITAASR